MQKKLKKLVATNRKARHNYFIEQTYEAGLVLFGTEVKSIRKGSVNLKDSYCSIDFGEIYVVGLHISPFEKGNIFNKDPLRKKKLLMHKKEIFNLYGLVKKQGYSIVPLSIYFIDSKVKLEIGLCKGKKLYDKRADIAKKDVKRKIDRAIKQNLV